MVVCPPPRVRRLRSPILCLAFVLASLAASASFCEEQAANAKKTAEPSPDEFFARQIEPLFQRRCYSCHSHAAGKIEGGLTLDSPSGWRQGGDGGPAIAPGAPDKSRLIAAVRRTIPGLEMPPDQKLPDAEITLLEQWVRRGAPDPRPAGRPASGDAAAKRGEWESHYRERLAWWSVRPPVDRRPPDVRQADWPRTEIDRFVLAALEARDLRPVAEADRRTLARRLNLALVGLPPSVEAVERFVGDDSPDAYDRYVQRLLDSPQFGEHWARRWMDVVHYSDTHGYEWDTPSKNGWRYRDYLVRAFNDDVPFRQLVLEQLAGDLIPPRMDPRTGVNESLHGPMAMRLGERRHGDNAQAEGVTQEAIANIIDTVGKGFLATTVACAQCHDHKLDAVEQRDYYGLAGTLMSTRWGPRCVDAIDPNVQTLDELRRLKREMRRELATLWCTARDRMADNIAALPITESPSAKGPEKPDPAGVPDTLAAIWRRVVGDAAASASDATETEKLAAAWHRWADELRAAHERRQAENRTNLRLVADFTRAELPDGWQIDGWGMRHGRCRDGEFAVADSGPAAIVPLLPAGRWSHVWSMRLAGAVRSPEFAHETPPATVTFGHGGGKFAAQALIVDNSFHGEAMKFLNQPTFGWSTVTAGRFTRLAGGQDETPRRIYLELVTKSLNNNFPPRTQFGGLKETEIADERSWFGVTRVYRHAAGRGPQDDLARFAPLLEPASPPEDRGQLARRLASLLSAAIDRWCEDRCDADDARLLNDALAAGWLPNESAASPGLARLVASYRETERRLQADRTIGSAADWNEGRDERIGVRGSYVDLGAAVPRGGIRLLGGARTRARETSSGRLEFAQSVADERNPLTARVFVNRVWHHMFGAGLVRTVDDFGHLGEQPSHPELLDHLAIRFMADDWSLKRLIARLATSSAWRQSSVANEAAQALDPENRLWHHLPMRRLEAESLRDSLLAVSGRLDATLYGPPIDPYRTQEDAAKRLVRGPLDGQGRRSLYLKMTLMEPPKFLAIFNQPIPKLTVGRRDSTNSPDQALALLNDPFVLAMARRWSDQELRTPAESAESADSTRPVDAADSAESADRRVRRMLATALARPADDEEAARLVRFARRSAELRGVGDAWLDNPQVWQDVAHAIFNLKEFLYVQ